MGTEAVDAHFDACGIFGVTVDIQFDIVIHAKGFIGNVFKLTIVDAGGGNLDERFDPVIDADEVDFEIWEMCDQDNSVHEQPTNNDDGTYTLEYAFEKDGIYEVYAHTTAHDMHTMPKKQIEVGAGGEYDCDENEAEEHHEHDEDHDDDDHEEHE